MANNDYMYHTMYHLQQCYSKLTISPTPEENVPIDMLGWWEFCRREMVKEQRRDFDGLFIYMHW